LKIAYSLSRKSSNLITAITASSANPAYPAENLFTGQISKVWRSVTAAAPIATRTLNISVPAGVTNCLGVYGCNSTAIAYAIKNAAETATYFSGTLDPTPASPIRKYNRVWLDWVSNGLALHIILTLTAPTTAVYHEIGEIVVNESLTMPDPKYGLKQGRKNLQVIQELAGGGFYIFNRPKPREFDLSLILTRETTSIEADYTFVSDPVCEFIDDSVRVWAYPGIRRLLTGDFAEFDNLDEIYENVGQTPLAMLINEGAENDHKWTGFFHMMSDPKASHDYPAFSPVSLSLREAV